MLHLTKKGKRMFAMLMGLMMILTQFGSLGTETAYADVHDHLEEQVVQETAVKAAAKAAGDTTVLAFSSDVHNQSNNTSANRLGTWIDNVEGKINGDIEVMAFGGDMAGAGWSGSDSYWTNTKADMTMITNKGVSGVYTTGNHEYSMGGNFNYSSYTSGSYATDDTKGKFKVNTIGAEGDDYIIYCLGSVSDTNAYTNQVDSLKQFLNSAGNSRVIYIITHFPLHTYSSRKTEDSGKVIDALNEAVENNGQTIVFLWGHNHTESDTYYDQIYGPGEGFTNTITYSGSSTKNLKFYYGAAGCMSDSDYGTGSGYVKGKGLISTITRNRGNATLTFTYYNANASDVTESNSVRSVDVTLGASAYTYQQTDTLEAGKEYLIASGNSGNVMLVSNEATGTTKQLKAVNATVTDGKITIDEETAAKVVFTAESNSNSSYGGFWLKNGEEYLYSANTPGLSMTSSSTLTSSDNKLKSWHYKGGDKNLLWFFKDETSDGYSDTSQTYRYYLDYSSGSYFTDAHVGSGQSLSGTSTPAVYLFARGSGSTTPVDPPSSDTIDITPSTSNPETSASIAVDETLTINVTNGSSSSSYDFTASLSTNGVAEITGSSTATIGAGQTGTFTVKGLKNGSVDITIQNNQSSSSYTRKATIHLTVGDGGGDDPVVPADKTVSITPTSSNSPEESVTIGVGETLDINVTNGSSSSSYNFTATLANSTVAEIKGNATVSIAAGDTGTITVKGIASGTVDISIQSNGSYSTRKATIHLTVGEGGGDDPVVPADKTVSITPTSSNSPEESVTIGVGETLDINVTNSSTSSAYNYTISLASTGVAEIQGNSTINIGTGSTGTFTVKGVASGTVDINIQNDQSNSSYIRKGVIHLTVGDGGTTPGVEETYVLTDTLEAGKEYLIATSNNGSAFLLSNETYTSGSTTGLKGVAATVSNGTVSITSSVAAKTLFTCEQDSSTDPYTTWLKIGEKYLYANNSGALRMESKSETANKYWHYVGNDGNTDKNLLWFFKDSEDTSGSHGYTYSSSTYRYYLQYDSNGNFTKGTATSTSLADTNTLPIYLFTKSVGTEPVSGVSLDKTTASIDVGKTVSLTATVLPENAANKAVTWSTSAPNVATVSNGVVTGIAEGTAVITVTTVDGEKTATCTVTVNPVAVTGVTLDKTSAQVALNGTTQLTATVAPEDATNKNVTWSSSNTSVATVDQTGKVTGKALGSATITVTTEDGSKTATCTVTVVQQKTYVITVGEFAMTSDRSPNTANGGNSSYTYTGLAGVQISDPADAPDNARWFIEETTGGYFIKDSAGRYLNATYESTNSSGKGDLKLDNVSDVWVLDSGYSLTDGHVDGSKLKSTNASATASSDKFLAYEDEKNLFSVRSSGNADTITVEEAGEPVAVTGITLDKTAAEVEQGKTLTLTATVAPADATNKRVEWTSSNENVATVDNGTVTGITVGTATITAKTVDGEYTAACTITVKEGTVAKYILTNELVDGGEYLIVNTSAVGSAYALKNNGASSSGVAPTASAVTIVSGDMILTNAEDIVWTAAETSYGIDLSNDGSFLQGKSSNLGVFSPKTYNDRAWAYDGTYLTFVGGSYTYELYYENGFTARSYNSGSATHPVYLFKKVTQEVAVTGITLDKTAAEVEVGKTVTLTATIEPANATNKKVTWTSSDDTKVTVSNGVVTGVAEGTVTITATTADGGKTAQCTVTVKPSTMTKYVLTDSLQTGKDYLIVSAKTAGRR